MTHTSLALTCGLLLVLQSCTDAETASFVITPVVGGSVVATGAALVEGRANLAAALSFGSETRTAAALATQPAPLPAVGIYDIDLAVTKRHAGLLGVLIESKVRGSTLELRSDQTYTGSKHGKPESAGTWSMESGKVILRQTHEKGKPVANRGTGTLEDGAFSVMTVRHGLTIHLVFQRRS